MPQKKIAKALCDLLVKHHNLPRKEANDIEAAFTNSTKEEFDDFVLEEGLVEESDLLAALGEYYQVPSFDVVGYLFNHDLIRKFPKGVMLRNGFIPVEVEGDVLIIVASKPTNDLLPIIGEHVSYDIRFNVGLKRDICDMVKEFYDESLTDTDNNIPDADISEG